MKKTYKVIAEFDMTIHIGSKKSCTKYMKKYDLNVWPYQLEKIK